MAGLFDGKIAAITGGASGIGLATARALHAGGATVVLVDRDRAALDALTRELGARCIAQVTDLLDPVSCDAMVPDILAQVGQIDILHCNAGTYIGGDLTETGPAEIDRMMALNTSVVMKNVHAVIPHMTARGSGDIMVTCSIAGHKAVSWEPVYAASKWAITCFTQVMRRQLAPAGIRVGQVSPGPVATPLLSDWEADRLQRARDESTLIEPEDIAEAIVFMLSRRRTITIRDLHIMPTAFDF